MVDKCSQCQTPLNHDALDGFCPICGLEGALTAVPHSAAEASWVSDHRAPLPLAAHGQVRRRLFGDYELLEEIGRGGMGVVYRARQRSLNRTVAVKLLLMGVYADDESVRRFKLESLSAARLQHPNIVAIHEVGTADGQHFFSMDFVQGQSLEAYAREHPLTTRHAAQLLRSTAEAIHFAHEHGIIHRDLKPSNILIDHGGHPRVTDFGLAKDIGPADLAAGHPQMTLTGQVLGSPSFLPPEQASGKRGPVAPTTDIYALGSILYFLLTGRPPFAGESLTDTLQSVLNDEPISPRLLNRSVPRDLDTICLKCLEKEPARRYGSAKTLAEELGRFLRSEPIHARPVAVIARAWRWCTRKPVVACLTVAVLLAIATGISGVVWQWRHSEHHRTLAEQKHDESRGNLYAADMLLAQAALGEENIGHAEEILRRHIPPPGEKDLRGWEWHYSWQQCQSDELFSLKHQNQTFNSLAITPDETLLVSGSGTGLVIVWDLEKRSPRKFLDFSSVSAGGVGAVAFTPNQQVLFIGTREGQVSIYDTKDWTRIGNIPTRQRVRSLAVSPDGKTLAVYGADAVRLVHLSNYQPYAALPLRDNNVRDVGGISFSRDSTRLAYGLGDGTIALWDSIRKTNFAHLAGHSEFVTALAFSPDDKLLISGSRDRTVRIWRMDDHSRHPMQLEEFPGMVTSLAVSPDGALLAVGGAGQCVRLFDTTTWAQVARYKGHTRAILSVAFGKNGNTLFTCSTDKSIRCWPVSTNADPNLSLCCPDARSAKLSDGGNYLHLVHSNETYSVWQTHPCRQILRAALPAGSPFRTIAISPDGKLWAAAPTNGGIKLFSTDDGRLAAELPPFGSPITHLAFSQDSRLLAGLQPEGVFHIWQCTSSPDGDYRSQHLNTLTSFGSKTPLLALPHVMTFGSTDNTLCVGQNGVTDFWDLRSRKKFAELIEDPFAVTDVTISRDRSKAFTASSSGLLRGWTLKSAQQTAVFRGQLISSLSVALSHDQNRIAACGSDGAVRIWDLRSMNQVATLKVHPHLREVAFADADTMVALASDRYNGSRLFVLRAPRTSTPPVSNQQQISDPYGRRARVDVASLTQEPKKLAQAAAQNLGFFGIPKRPPATHPNLIDLSCVYNTCLDGKLPSRLAPPNGEKTPFDQARPKWIDYDLRGAIRLAAANELQAGYPYPIEVAGIPLGIKCRRLHFLHYVSIAENEGVEVAKYILRFKGGKMLILPIRYGEHLRTGGPFDPKLQLRDPNSRALWTNRVPNQTRLFQMTWHNPHPAVRINTLDFRSSTSRSRPVLVAITAEP